MELSAFLSPEEDESEWSSKLGGSGPSFASTEVSLARDSATALVGAAGWKSIREKVVTLRLASTWRW